MIRHLLPAVVGFCLPALCAPPDPAAVRAAAERSIALLQNVGAKWTVPCYSCHHQALPAVALQSARAHGLAVDEAAAVAVARRTLAPLGSIDDAVQDSRLIDPAMSEGYFLWGAQASGVAPNLAAEVAANRLVNLQRADGHWSNFDARPPHSDSYHTSTALAVAAVAYYLPPERAAAGEAALSRARRWLLATRPASTEDATFRLLGLHWAHAPASELHQAAQDLLERRHADGGWPQNASLASDAYSTGQAVAALRQTGQTPADHPAIQAGIAWLLKTQRPDGAWLVQTRLQTKVDISPPYFESGFPGGHSQYLSCAATSWAVMALAEVLPASNKPLKSLEIPVAGEQPWMRAALFGDAAGLAALLDKGLSPNAASPEGTTVLMMASGDEAKVRLLLRRGANVNARAKSGFDALLVASLVNGNRPVLKQLFAKGASAATRPGVKYRMTPMMMAAFAGDPGMAEELLDHGADAGKVSLLVGTAAVKPFLVAVSMEQYDLVRFLVKRGHNVDETDGDGMTNLSMAALGHRDELVRFLLDLGADPAHVDKFGLTPLQHTAGITGYGPETAELLRAGLRKKP